MNQSLGGSARLGGRLQSKAAGSVEWGRNRRSERRGKGGGVTPKVPESELMRACGMCANEPSCLVAAARCAARHRYTESWLAGQAGHDLTWRRLYSCPAQPLNRSTTQPLLSPPCSRVPASNSLSPS